MNRTGLAGALCTTLLVFLPPAAKSHSNGEAHGEAETEPVIRLGMSPAPGALVARNKEGDRLIRDAVAATGRGNHDAALQLYREAASIAPEQGIPALARFLKLTGRDDELAAMLATPNESGFEGLPPLAIARGLYAAGDVKSAIRALEGDMYVQNGDDAAGTLLLARLYESDSRPEDRQLLLLKATMTAEDNSKRFVLWHELFAGNANAILSDPGLLLSAMGQGLRDPGISYGTLLPMLDEAVLKLQQRPDYFQNREEFLAGAAEHGAGAVLFATRMLNREERHDEALDYLKSHLPGLRQSPLWEAVAEEHGELLRQTGKLEEFRNSLEQRARASKGRTAVRLNLESARVALALKDNRGAEAALDRIERESIPDDLHSEFILARLLAFSRMQDIDRLIEVYPDSIGGAREDDVELYHHVIFTNILDTESHLAIESKVRDLFARDDKSPPVLWRLAAEASVASRRKPNEVEALYQWVTRSPDNTAALDQLAKVSGELATELASAPEELLAVDPDEIEKTVRVADQALRQVILRRPWEPDAYVSLLGLEEAKGSEDPADVLVQLVNSESSGFRDRETLGFVLATNGYPETAMTLYDELLEHEPENVSVQMNRAACLTRLERWDEAITFYKSILDDGYEGEPWHVHELVGRLWEIGKHLEREKEFIEWFRAAPSRVRGDWGMTIVEEFGSLCAHQGRIDLAEEFLRRTVDESDDPNIKSRAWLRLVRTHAEAGDRDEAVSILAEAEENLASWPEQFTDLKLQHAELLITEDRKDEALNMLISAAATDPQDAFLADALHRAAQIAQELNQQERALSLYREFLDSPSRSFLRRQHAEEQIEILDSRN